MCQVFIQFFLILNKFHSLYRGDHDIIIIILIRTLKPVFQNSYLSGLADN